MQQKTPKVKIWTGNIGHILDNRTDTLVFLKITVKKIFICGLLIFVWSLVFEWKHGSNKKMFARRCNVIAMKHKM